MPGHPRCRFLLCLILLAVLPLACDQERVPTIDPPPILEPSSSWQGFDEANAPDGPVNHLAEYQGALIVSGSFDHAGSVAASGLARWDGAQWTAMGWTNGPSPSLLVEGDVLVAGGPDTGFYQWTGSGWASIAPGYPGASGAVLYHGEIVVAKGSLCVWRGGEWALLARPSRDRTSTGPLAIYLDSIFVAANTISGMFMDDTAWIGQVIDGGLFSSMRSFYGESEGMSSADVVFLKGVGDNLFFQWRVDSTGWISWGFERLSASGFEPIGGSTIGEPTLDKVWGAAELEGKTYVGATLSPYASAVLVQAGSTFRKLAEASGGEVLDVAAFQGGLYVAGSFTGIGGVPSYRIARFTP